MIQHANSIEEIDRSSHRPPVIIIGAGLASLALAQGLKKHDVPIQVFERDSSASHRPQGYRIKIFEQTDQNLVYLLPPHLLWTFYASCAETVLGESTYSAISGQKLASRQGWKPRPWTVDRDVLRNVLLLDLEEGHEIEFGKEFDHYEFLPGGDSVTAVFAGGSRFHGAFLVGGDGSRSRVRRQLLPRHRGIDIAGVCIYGKTPLTPELTSISRNDALRWITTFRYEAPLLSQVMSGRNDSMTFFVDPMRFANRAASDLRVSLPDDYVYWALRLHRGLIPEETGVQSHEKGDKSRKGNTGSMEPLNGTAARRPSLRITGEWDPAVRSMLELQDADCTAALPILCAHPDLLDWEANELVTVIGDSIHHLPPSGAAGAVTALQDAALLVAKIVASKEGDGDGDWRERNRDGYISRDGVARYEEAMRVNARASIQHSQRAGAMLYGQPPFEECQEIEV